ncbi:MAG: hypothetical protein AMXMBFR55_33090 [Gemmatimonadota bacterium]
MRFLNGFKTALGGLGLLVTALNDSLHVLPDTWRPYVVGASAVLTALGVIHKAEKRQESKATPAAGR